MVRIGAGAVVHDVLAPAVEHVTMGVGEAVGDVRLKLERVRPEAPDAAVAKPNRAGQRFGLGAVEGALLEVERSARIEREAVGRVVRIGRVDAAEHAAVHIGLVVAVGILEEHNVGRLGQEHAAVPELEAGDAVQPIRKDDHLVGLAVVIRVFEDEQLVVHRVLRLPMRIGRPGRDPQPALRVERHLHRIDQIGEGLLVGEERHLQPVGDGHLGERLLPAEEKMRAVGSAAGQVGRHVDERLGVAVVDRQVRALGDGPDPRVAVGGHGVEDFHLAVHHHAVADAVGVASASSRLRIVRAGSRLVAKFGSAAIHVVAVDDAVALIPMEVLVRNGRLQLRDRAGLVRSRRPEQRVADRLGDELVAVLVQVNAVDRQRLVRLSIQVPADREQVDERYAAGLGDFGHRIGIDLQSSVVRAAVG